MPDPDALRERQQLSRIQSNQNMTEIRTLTSKQTSKYLHR